MKVSTVLVCRLPVVKVFCFFSLEKKSFLFFEKKKQKTFARLGAWPAASVSRREGDVGG